MSSNTNANSPRNASPFTDSPVMHSELAAAEGAALVGFLQQGTGAVLRTLQDRAYERISAKDFGAIGDGVHDDTAAIQAAVNYGLSLSTRAEIFLPAGTYLTSSTINQIMSSPSPGVWINGAGRNSTVISPNGSFLCFASQCTEFDSYSNFTIKPTTGQTSGYGIYWNTNSGSTIENVIFDGCYSCVYANATGVFYIRNVNAFAVGKDFIDIVGANGTGIMSDMTVTGVGASGAGVGINVTATGGLFMSNCDVINFGTGMLLQPIASSDQVDWLSISNCDFDTCGTCLLIAPFAASTAGVQGCVFDGCWFSTALVNGVRCIGSGIVSGVVFNACRVFNNGNEGMLFTGGTDITVKACLISGNSQSTPGSYAGLSIGTSNIIVEGNTIGQLGFFANTQAGLALSGTTSRFAILGNLFGTNTTTISTTGTYTNFRFQNNIGASISAISPMTTAVIGASPYTYTNSGAQSQSISVQGGTISQLTYTRGPNTAALPNSGQFRLDPGDSLTIVYTVAPTIKSWLTE